MVGFLPATLCHLLLAATTLPQPARALWPSWSRPAFGKRTTTTVAESSVLWVPQDIYQGDHFFDRWDFYSDADPTHGNVDYVDRDTALQSGLAFVQGGQATMQVDNTSWLAPGQSRSSVRIESKAIYNGGLFILDVAHAPFGCSVWPGYWTLGTASTWPGAGEIDIVEGVHNNQHDQVTWHTAPGCALTAPGNFSGSVTTTDCVANDQGGCGIVDWSRSSYGPLFAQLGGGVYAMRWDENSIDVWFFYRAAVPPDIALGAPNPSLDAWGLPTASMSSKSCDLKKYFVDHKIIFDITICGDWAGSDSYATDGCPGSCVDRVQDPSNFANATWVINSLTVFRKSTLAGRITSDAPARTRAPVSVLLLSFGIAALLMAVAA